MAFGIAMYRAVAWIMFLLGPGATVLLRFLPRGIAPAELYTWSVWTSLVFVFVSVLVMAVHLLLSSELSRDSKKKWWLLLAIGGPFTACYYLMTLEHRIHGTT